MKNNTQVNERTDYLVRLPSIIGPNGVLPISKSAFLLGVKTGRYPRSVKLGPRTTAWRWSDILHIIENGVCENGGQYAE